MDGHAGGRRKREPEIVVMVSSVVMTHAGEPVDDFGGGVQPIGVNLHRYKNTGVPERAGVEDGADLADDTAFLQSFDAAQRFACAEANLRGDLPEGLGGKWKLRLEFVEQYPVCVVEIGRYVRSPH